MKQRLETCSLALRKAHRLRGISRNLALTWPTSGGRSVGIVRWRTKAPEFFTIGNLLCSVSSCVFEPCECAKCYVLESYATSIFRFKMSRTYDLLRIQFDCFCRTLWPLKGPSDKSSLPVSLLDRRDHKILNFPLLIILDENLCI
jgi:hypothetical protein